MTRKKNTNGKAAAKTPGWWKMRMAFIYDLIPDSSLPEGTYAASQILLDKNDPTQVLQRMDNWFIGPDKNYETTGQVNHVCFVEGLVQFNNKWFLYYGTADSKIAVAVK